MYSMSKQYLNRLGEINVMTNLNLRVYIDTTHTSKMISSSGQGSVPPEKINYLMPAYVLYCESKHSPHTEWKEERGKKEVLKGL